MINVSSLAQEEDEEITAMTTKSGKLVFTVNAAEPFEVSPEGIFELASSTASISFDKGDALEFLGTDEERPAAEIERVVVRDGRLLIYLRGGRAFPKVEISPFPLPDGVWTNRRSGTSFVVDDGRMVSCKGCKSS